ncbi:MAG: hypothetical protein LBT09_09435 [Planctomycetaceae bacterium]|jgi:hypothetical protein|nr:hypothetical protein [Planctomycetaceae bacterium]
MKHVADLFTLLKSSLTFENPTILTLGQKWFQENLILPIINLTAIDLDIDKFNKNQSTIFFMALQAVGDIAFLVRGYSSANYWYRKFHLFDNDDLEILHDIAYTYELIRDFDNAKKYYQEYFGDNHTIELSEEYDFESSTKLHIYDQLVKFQPKFVIDSYQNTEQIEIYRLVTTAYFMLGKEFENNVYNRMEYYFQNAVAPSIDRVDLFYAIDFFCDQPQFWQIILNYKPNIDIIDHNFDTQNSTSKATDTNINDILLLHLIRSCNDLKTMKNLLKNDYLYIAADSCIKFYNVQNRMPKWKEFYTLMDTIQQNTNE